MIEIAGSVFGILKSAAESVPAQVLWGAGVVVGIFQLRHLRKTAESENERKRREYALSYSLTRNATHVEARQALAEIFGSTTETSRSLPLEQINVEIERDSQTLSYIRLLLNHWENMALAIYRGVADEDTAFEMVSQRVINTVRQYRYFIEQKHEISPNSYKYLVWLAKRWSSRHARSRLNPAVRLSRPKAKGAM